MNRYVYHAPWEPTPRPVASGDQNVVGLGYIMENPIVRGLLPQRTAPVTHPICPAWGCGGPPVSMIASENQQAPPDYVLRQSGIMSLPIRTPQFMYPTSGATATIPQPPPSAGGSNVVPVTRGIPLSPAPSPTVAVGASQTAPQLTQPGTTLDSSGASITTSSGIGSWLGESTLISGIPNWGLAAGALLAAMMFMGGKSGRR